MPPVVDALAARSRLITAVMLLIAIGLVMVYSTTAVSTPFGGTGGVYLRRQLLWCVLALGGLLLAWGTSYRWICRLAPFFLAASLVLLVVVLLPQFGHESHRARRWLRLGGIGIQPSEFAKLALILFLARYCADAGPRLQEFKRGLLPALAAILVTAGLILPEPDFGTAIFVAAVGLTVLLVAGIRVAHLIGAGLMGLPLMALVAYQRFDHVRDRLLTFLSPETADPAKAHQIKNSLIALGSGGYWGLGLGAGRQKLAFLPEDHNDFIFSALGEELGLMGGILVLACFAAFLYYGLRILTAVKDRAGFLLAFGIVFSIVFQAVVHVAVVTASVPTKGISLPFVSFGGSALFVMCLGVGILLNIAGHAAAQEGGAS